MDDEAMDDDESFFAPQPTVCTGPHRLPSPNAAGGIAEESDAEAPETNHAPTTVTMPRVSSCNPESQPIEPTSHPGDRLEDNRFTDYGYRSSSTPTTTLSPLLPSTSHRQLHLRATLLDEGVMPPPAAVRFEEFINWFDLRLRRSEPRPRSHRRRRPSPFDEDNLLVRVGVQAEQIADNERPPVSLTFIVDTSGSMDRDDRLGLVRESLPHPRRTNSTTTDTVAIVAWTIRGDIGEVFLRWEDPQTGEVIEIDEDIDLRDVEENWSDTSIDFQLATVVTAFGEVMRDNPYADDVNLSNIHVEAGRVADQR
ncbi:hypothetical protein GQR58_030080 [Nymphon striatum]|nr:hypothetical protein GQR58_030080 [Nymphon striatum]